MCMNLTFNRMIFSKTKYQHIKTYNYELDRSNYC